MAGFIGNISNFYKSDVPKKISSPVTYYVRF